MCGSTCSLPAAHAAAGHLILSFPSKMQLAPPCPRVDTKSKMEQIVAQGAIGTFLRLPVMHALPAYVDNDGLSADLLWAVFDQNDHAADARLCGAQ